MTGYGQATAEVSDSRLTVEVRSLNHRYADVRLKLPSDLVGQESEIRRRILSRVKRGRVELSVSIDRGEADEPRPQLNRPLLEEVVAAYGTLSQELGVAAAPDANAIVAVHGMFRNASVDTEWTEAHQGAFDRALGAALDTHDGERVREGGLLRDELLERLERMISLAGEIRKRAAEVPRTVRERLVERLTSLAPEVELDPTRLAQEAAIQADRCDVTEEMVRLDGHLQQACTLLREPDGEALGKRIDFLLQEINREGNTINSKSADLEMSRCALAMRAELEKVREQIQNVE